MDSLCSHCMWYKKNPLISKQRWNSVKNPATPGTECEKCIWEFMLRRVWPCMVSIICRPRSGLGSWLEQHSGGPLASLTLEKKRSGADKRGPSPSPERTRGDKGLFPNATAEPAASREDALNCGLLSALPGKIIDGPRRPQKQKADWGLLRCALQGKSHCYHGSESAKKNSRGHWIFSPEPEVSLHSDKFSAAAEGICGEKHIKNTWVI